MESSMMKFSPLCNRFNATSGCLWIVLSDDMQWPQLSTDLAYVGYLWNIPSQSPVNDGLTLPRVCLQEIFSTYRFSSKVSKLGETRNLSPLAFCRQINLATNEKWRLDTIFPKRTEEYEERKEHTLKLYSIYLLQNARIVLCI
ncbi:hypothetical protein HNY73_020664 [Argiope bruennichi]|uniref:Uncharacterized protein n=1 Tax=Argiope bruennichi TaxID=94029 RepID=A0A8T0EC71_ARGBR|nr:hypothetical protein HNY73_020664 [Argiope bruennichi]